MRGKDLLECMEQIDDALVEEALEPAVFPRRNAKAVKWGMAAACVVVLGISATAFWSHQNMKKMPIEHAGDTAAPMSAAAGADSGSSGQLAEGAPTDAGAADGTGQLAGGVPTAGSAADGVQNDAGAAGKETEDSADAPVALTAADRKEEGEGLAVSVESLDESKKESDEEAGYQYTVISDYYDEKDSSVYDYPVPEKGAFFCYHYLQKTTEYYEKQGNTAEATEDLIYAYDVVIDLYGDVERTDGSGVEYRPLKLPETASGNEKIEQEYRRLAELGYHVRLSEDFQLTGTFTKVELDTFQASPEYGYTFRFASED